jgi:hypothetical protein
VVWSALASFFTIIACACSRADIDLQERITEAVARNEGAAIHMAAIADFEWDHLYIFQPYIASEAIDQELGFHWCSARCTGIHNLDSITLLVFVQDSGVVAYVEAPRGEGDFAAIEHPGGISREAAVFEVRRVGHGDQSSLFLYEVAGPAA